MEDGSTRGSSIVCSHTKEDHFACLASLITCLRFTGPIVTLCCGYIANYFLIFYFPSFLPLYLFERLIRYRNHWDRPLSERNDNPKKKKKKIPIVRRSLRVNNPNTARYLAFFFGSRERKILLDSLDDLFERSGFFLPRCDNDGRTFKEEIIVASDRPGWARMAPGPGKLHG